MFDDLDNLLKHLRIESKAEENRNKPPISSPDIVYTTDFIFSPIERIAGDSGKLLLAQNKTNPNKRYLVKHEYTDCACNEYVYTKLAEAMGYCMPDAVLFQISLDEDFDRFRTEYVIGERFLNVIDSDPPYAIIREQAKNWYQYFGFRALYAMTGECDGIEVLLADDSKIYRVDTTDAFPLSVHHLSFAGVNQNINGMNPYISTKNALLSADFDNTLYHDLCDFQFEKCLKIYRSSVRYFLEPFERIQEISKDYIDDFLNTLCYFYPDFIGDYFKRYISGLQKQCAAYLREKQ